MSRFPRSESLPSFSKAKVHSSGTTASLRNKRASVNLFQGDTFQPASDFSKLQKLINVELAHAKAAYENRPVTSRLQDLFLARFTSSKSPEAQRLRDAKAIAVDAEMHHFENGLKYPLTRCGSKEPKAYLQLTRLANSGNIRFEIYHHNQQSAACVLFERLGTEIAVDTLVGSDHRDLVVALLYNLAKTAVSESRTLRIRSCSPELIADLVAQGFRNDPHSELHTISFIDTVTRQLKTIRTSLELVADPKKVIACYLNDPKWTVSSARH